VESDGIEWNQVESIDEARIGSKLRHGLAFEIQFARGSFLSRLGLDAWPRWSHSRETPAKRSPSTGIVDFGAERSGLLV